LIRDMRRSCSVSPLFATRGVYAGDLETEMDRDTSKVVAVAALRSAAELSNLLPLLQRDCSADEYTVWRDRIADASAKITTSVLSPIFQEHPDLETEIDAHYAKFGRPA